MRVPNGEKLNGLNLYLKVGKILKINDGEMQIQVYETHQNAVRLSIRAPRDKYKINRTDKPRREDGCEQDT